MDASELSFHGSGMKMSCSSHSFQSVLQVDLDTGAISIVNLLMSPFFMSARSLVNSRMTDSWSNTGVPKTGVPLIAVIYDPLMRHCLFLDSAPKQLCADVFCWISCMYVRPLILSVLI